jgi:hypothetical protein
LSNLANPPISSQCFSNSPPFNVTKPSQCLHTSTVSLPFLKEFNSKTRSVLIVYERWKSSQDVEVRLEHWFWYLQNCSSNLLALKVWWTHLAWTSSPSCYSSNMIKQMQNMDRKHDGHLWCEMKTTNIKNDYALTFKQATCVGHLHCMVEDCLF